MRSMRLGAIALLGAAMLALPIAASAQSYGPPPGSGYGGYGSGPSPDQSAYNCQTNPKLTQLMQQRDSLNNQISQAYAYHDENSAQQLSSQLDYVNKTIGSYGPDPCSSNNGGYGASASGGYGNPGSYAGGGYGGAPSGGYGGYGGAGAPNGYGSGGMAGPGAYGAYGAPSGGYAANGAPANGQNSSNGGLASMIGPFLQNMFH
jgi:hypothetical protein